MDHAKTKRVDTPPSYAPNGRHNVGWCCRSKRAQLRKTTTFALLCCAVLCCFSFFSSWSAGLTFLSPFSFFLVSHCRPSHKSFKTKTKLAKAAHINRPLPNWVRFVREHGQGRGCILCGSCRQSTRQAGIVLTLLSHTSPSPLHPLFNRALHRHALSWDLCRRLATRFGKHLQWPRLPVGYLWPRTCASGCTSSLSLHPCPTLSCSPHLFPFSAQLQREAPSLEADEAQALEWTRRMLPSLPWCRLLVCTHIGL